MRGLARQVAAVTGPFRTVRADGRSDRRVIVDLVSGSPAGTQFDYEKLTAALQAGLDDPVDRARIYRAVAQANRTLLEEDQRYLQVVKNQGYRLLHGSDHLPAALVKKDMAQGYIRRGVELLRGARLDELTEAQRVLHQGQLMILAGVHQAMQDSQRRHDRQEQVIDELRQRVERLEG